MKTFKIILTLTLATNLYSSIGLGDIKDSNALGKVTDMFDSKVEQFSSIDLNSLGLGGLDYENVANVNMSVFKGFLSAECEIPLLPQIPDDFCSDLFNDDFKFVENLNLGLCTVGVDTTKGDANDIMKKKDEYIDMAKEMCQKGANTGNTFSKWVNDKMINKGAETMGILAPVNTVRVKSEFTQERDIKINDYTLPNGLKNSDIVKPNGIVGFDKIYNHDEKIPNSLREAYFKNDYLTYNTYERYAKIAQPDKNGELDLKNISPQIPETYLDYMQQVQVGTKETFTAVPTIYEFDKQLNNELNLLQKKTPLNLNTSKSSIEMKADYLAYKKSVSDKLMDINSSTVLKKMTDNINSQENIKFMQNEENHRLKNLYIIQPSKLKLETIPTSDKLIYAEKIRKQQEDEIKRGAEFLRESKNKKELAKLIAEKVFITNFEYNSEISQKEVEEILTQANSQ